MKFIQTITEPLKQRMRSNKKVKIALILLPILIIAIFAFSGGNNPNGSEEVADTDINEVSIIRLGMTGTENEVIYPGLVEDRGAATLRAESSGQVTSVPVTRGRRVSEGTIIATLENARERAAVAQAQAGVTTAEANLARITGSVSQSQTRSLETAVQQAERDLSNVQDATVVAINNFLATTENIAAQYSNPFFNEPYSFFPRFKYAAELTNANLRWDAEELQIELQNRFRRARDIVAQTDANDNLPSTINELITELETLEELLDTLLQASTRLRTNERLTAVDVAGLRSSIATARSSYLSTISALNAQIRALENAEYAVEQARISEEGGAMGTAQEDRLIAEAGLQQAQAALQAATASLEDTIIRAPVDGIITELFVDKGDTVSTFQEIAQIERVGALEATASIPVEIISSLSIGDAVDIDSTSGRIVEIAPSASISQTVEVVISLDETNRFSSGQPVTITFRTTGVGSNGDVLVPLTAIFSTPRQQYVFTIEDDVLVLVPVEVGRLQGSFAEITSGLEQVDEIVEDARGLSEGEIVKVI